MTFTTLINIFEKYTNFSPKLEHIQLAYILTLKYTQNLSIMKELYFVSLPVTARFNPPPPKKNCQRKKKGIVRVNPYIGSKKGND